MKNNITFFEGKGSIVLVTAETEAEKNFLIKTLLSFFRIETETSLPGCDKFFFEKNGHHYASLCWHHSQNGMIDIDENYKQDLLKFLEECLSPKNTIESPY
jgi:hypothetical protein